MMTFVGFVGISCTAATLPIGSSKDWVDAREVGCERTLARGAVPPPHLAPRPAPAPAPAPARERCPFPSRRRRVFPRNKERREMHVRGSASTRFIGTRRGAGAPNCNCTPQPTPRATAEEKSESLSRLTQTGRGERTVRDRSHDDRNRNAFTRHCHQTQCVFCGLFFAGNVVHGARRDATPCAGGACGQHGEGSAGGARGGIGGRQGELAWACWSGTAPSDGAAPSAPRPPWSVEARLFAGVREAFSLRTQTSRSPRRCGLVRGEGAAGGHGNLPRIVGTAHFPRH